MKTQNGGDTLREMEEERQKGRKGGRELLKTKDFIHIPVNLTGLVVMLSPECKHEVKTVLLTLESKEVAWSQCKLLA